MEKYIELVFDKVINNFDFAFVIIANILSYIIIRMVYAIKKGAYVTTWSKRFILMGATLIIGIIYWFSGYDKLTVIINSAILAPVFWDWILRPIFIKFGIDYRRFEKYDDTEVNTTIETKDTIVDIKTK